MGRTMNHSLTACPICGGRLRPVKLGCHDCSATIEGEFRTSLLGLLSDEQQRFILAFIGARGNIREVERDLGISYPTVRKRLEEVNQALGNPSRNERESQLSILDAVVDGELTARDAIAQLRRPG